MAADLYRAGQAWDRYCGWLIHRGGGAIEQAFEPGDGPKTFTNDHGTVPSWPAPIAGRLFLDGAGRFLERAIERSPEVDCGQPVEATLAEVRRFNPANASLPCSRACYCSSR